MVVYAAFYNNNP